MIRESDVKGKLAMFLAGMRTFVRDHRSLSTDGQSPLPPVLSEFIVWAGDVLSGEVGASGSSGSRSPAAVQGSLDAVARRYVGVGSGRDGGGGGSQRAAAAAAAAAAAEDCCSICLEGLGDAAAAAELGEPLVTRCGHRFHALCFARHLSASQQDPWCPNCRSPELDATFPDAGLGV